MKNYYKIIVILMLFSTSIYSQSGQEGLKLISQYEEGNVQLRWIPMNHDIWEKGNQYGYNLVKKFHIDGNLIEENLFTGFKPLSESEWDAAFPNNNAAGSAKMMLYDQSINTAPPVIDKLSDAIEKKEQVEGKHLFALIAAESDFEVAKGMALGFTDTNILPDVFYTYILSINSDEVMSKIDPAESHPQDVSFSEVSTLSAQADDDKAMLITWDIEEYADVYSYWNIERSDDPSHFAKVNVDPFYHSYTEDVYEFKATYKDVIQDCDHSYFYRVQGVTSFGTKGPYSNVIEISCAPKKMRLPLVINGSINREDGILINWNTFDPVYEDSIIGFNVYRADDVHYPKELLNSEMLRPREREYLDRDTITSTYYYLEAIDIYGVAHHTKEHFVQVMDSIPPAAPTWGHAEFKGEQSLIMSWNKNEEPDVRGYHVYQANTRNGEYIKKNSNLLFSTNFSMKFHANIASDSVFLKLRAEDHFFNSSEYSEILALARPDVWAPGKPVLEYAYPTQKGVALAWQYGRTSDIKKHVIQRRPENSYTWKDLLIVTRDNEEVFQQTIEIPGQRTLANHIDTVDHIGGAYIYRLSVYDEADNRASSDWITVTPFPTGGGAAVIKDFSVELMKASVPPDGKLLEQLQNLNSPNLDKQIEALTEEVYNAALNWNCVLSRDIDAFIIYRSMTGSGFQPVKTISLGTAMGLEPGDVITGSGGSQDYHYIDKDLQGLRRYVYYIVAKYKNGAESKRSKLITVKVQ